MELVKRQFYEYHWGMMPSWTSPVRVLICVLFFHPYTLSARTDEKQELVTWQEIYEQATALEKAANYTDAINRYEQGLEIAEQIGDEEGIAKTVIAIGGIRTKLGEYAEAMKLVQRGRQLSEKQNDRSILVSALVAISGLEERQSRYPEALQIANQALQIAQETKNEQSLAAAYRSVGHCYYYQGQFKIALENYRQSLTFAEETKNPSEICRSLLATGVAVLDTGDYDRGVQYLHSAVEKAEEAGEKGMITGILSETGIAYKEMGMYEEAADYYHRSLRAAEEIGEKETKARILNNLGILSANEGRNDEAIHYYHQSLKIAEELKNQRGIALLFNNIGNIFREEGRFEEALSYYERSLKTREEIGDQWGIASALMNMGVIFEKRENYGKAIDVYSRSLEISEQTGNKSRVALTLRHLGEAYRNWKEYQLAEENYRKALSIGKEVQSKLLIGYSLEGLGNVRLDLQKYSEAEEYFRQTLAVAREMNQPEMIWRASYGLAKTYGKEGRPQQALNFYAAAIQEIEEVRARASSDEGKSGFLAKHVRIYEDVISLLYRLKQKYPEKNYEVQAFDYAERARARMFLDALAEFQSGIRKGLNKEQLRREKVILSKITKLQSEIRDDGNGKDPTEKKKKLSEVEREFDQFVLDLKLQSPHYAQLKYPKPSSLSQIKKQLHANAVLLEFFVGEKESFVFAVTSIGQQIKSLPGKAQLEESVRTYLERIRIPPKASLGTDAKSLQQIYRKQAHALFQLLIAPVEQQLKGKEDLILILDGILHYVPFETFIIDRDSVLIEHFRITYAPSATIWATLQGKPKLPNAKELVAFADPVLGLKSSESSEELQGTALSKLVRLRYTREEVEGIASLYPQTSREIYLAEEATEEKFRNEEISQYKVVHFATHALINEEIPRRSGIVLSPEANGESDGVLQMHEIWNLDLSTELVVLSACQTGLGRVVSGEGMVSLMRAFFYAGTRNVVVSLWNVDDQSTANLMKEFYTQIKSGKSHVESLRQAKLNMIKDARSGSNYAAYEDPYYWGPFILIGTGE